MHERQYALRWPVRWLLMANSDSGLTFSQRGQRLVSAVGWEGRVIRWVRVVPSLTLVARLVICPAAVRSMWRSASTTTWGSATWLVGLRTPRRSYWLMASRRV